MSTSAIKSVIVLERVNISIIILEMRIFREKKNKDEKEKLRG